MQQYFQERVKAWLATVAIDVLHVKHYWLRYEFAPSRGQIHAHMLLICDTNEVQQECTRLKHDKVKLATYLSIWLGQRIGLTASLDSKWADLDLSIENHPSTVSFSSLSKEESVKDVALCQLSFQTHKCSAYCMQTRQQIRKNESPEEKKRRVCRSGAGVEAHFGACDTPGFVERKNPKITRDLRGFDRLDMPRNQRRITQASTYLCQSW